MFLIEHTQNWKTTRKEVFDLMTEVMEEIPSDTSEDTLIETETKTLCLSLTWTRKSFRMAEPLQLGLQSSPTPKIGKQPVKKRST